MPGRDAATLDMRFTSECPNCGRRAGWSGGVEEKHGRVFLDMACTYCSNSFLEMDPKWEARFRGAERPTFTEGAR